MSFTVRLWRKLPVAVTHGLLLLSGTSVAQIIPAVAAPALTRLYTPADFGVFALVYAFLGIVSSIACLRYELAIVLPDDERESLQIASVCMLIIGAVAVFTEAMCLLVWLFLPYPRVAHFALPLMAMVPTGVVLMGFMQLSQMWCLRTHAFRITSMAVITQAIITVVAQIGLALMGGSNPYFLIAGTQLGLLGGAGVYFYMLHAIFLRGVWTNFSINAARILATRYRRFPIYTAPYAFVSQASARGNLWIFATFAATAAVGQFALAQRVEYLPVTTVVAAASQVFFSRASRRPKDPRLLQGIERALMTIPVVFTPPFILLFLFAEPLFGFLFGAAWVRAGSFASYLAIPSLAIFSVAWLDRLYDILGRQRLALGLEIVNNVAALSAVYIAFRLTHDPVLAAAAYAASVFLYCILWTHFTLRIAGLTSRSLGIGLLSGLSVAGLLLAVDIFVRSISRDVAVQFALMLVLSVPIIALGIVLAVYGRNLRQAAISIFSARS